MTLRPVLLLLVLLATAFPGTADEIEGVEFPDVYLGGDAPMKLNGVGLLRYRLVFKGYVAALYLGEDVPSERALEDVPRRLEIEYFWSIDAQDFARATEVGIARNLDAASVDRFRAQIAAINALYEDVEPGDRYALTYVPGRGTELALNGELRGTVPGAEFSAALFSIWLGENPLSRELREKLLPGG